MLKLKQQGKWQEAYHMGSKITNRFDKLKDSMIYWEPLVDTIGIISYQNCNKDCEKFLGEYTEM